MSCQHKILVQVMLRLSLDCACLYFGGLFYALKSLIYEYACT
jgi:hypothetical protein